MMDQPDRFEPILRDAEKRGPGRLPQRIEDLSAAGPLGEALACSFSFGYLACRRSLPCHRDSSLGCGLASTMTAASGTRDAEVPQAAARCRSQPGLSPLEVTVAHQTCQVFETWQVFPRVELLEPRSAAEPAQRFGPAQPGGPVAEEGSVRGAWIAAEIGREAAVLFPQRPSRYPSTPIHRVDHAVLRPGNASSSSESG
jgi:hypothetical protein